MTRTQIQLPEELYAALKRLAAAKEWTLAETIRRAAERYLEAYPEASRVNEGWTLPEPMRLGRFRRAAETWREVANLEAGESDKG